MDTLWQMTNEVRVIAYNDLAVIKFWYLIGYFFSRKQRRNQKYVHCCVCHTNSTIQRRAWCGCYVIWIIAAIRQERMTLLVAIMMLITGALGLCREHTKLCILYFCSAVHIKKRILKKKISATWQQCFCFCVHFCSATQNHKLSILCCDGNLTPTPPRSTYSAL